MPATVLRPGEGERIGSGAAVARIMATVESTNGAFTLTETTIPPGFPGPPRHRHDRMTDAFFVLEGTLTVHLDDEAITLEPGSYVSVPPDTVHTFSNHGIVSRAIPQHQFAGRLGAIPPGDRPPDGRRAA